jgi:YVTN family beta-propeller protein
VLARIPVGKRPRGIRLSRDGRQLLVALSGSAIAGPGVDVSSLPPPDRRADGIGIVDIATAALLRTHRSGQDPEAFDISLDGTKLYVSNEDMAEISVLDLATGAVTARVKVGEEPEAVARRPDGRIVYVGCEPDNEVVAVDTSTGKVVGRIAVGARPRGIAFTADAATAFAASENGGTVSVIDGRATSSPGRSRYRRSTAPPPRPGPWDSCFRRMARICSSLSAGPARSRSSMCARGRSQRRSKAWARVRGGLP